MHQRRFSNEEHLGRTLVCPCPQLLRPVLQASNPFVAQTTAGWAPTRTGTALYSLLALSSFITTFEALIISFGVDRTSLIKSSTSRPGTKPISRDSRVTSAR